MQKSNSTPLILVLAMVVAMLLLANAAWAAVPEKVLVSFNSTSANGPSGLSMDAAGNLWGVASDGGTGSCADEAPLTGCGTVFELSPVSGGWGMKVIYSFQGGHDGAVPSGQLAFDTAGNVYGVTVVGGGSTSCSNGCGTVFKLTPESGGRYKESVIYRFNPTHVHNDGETPISGLVIDATGNLYGTTYEGGNGCGSLCGTVFQLSPTSGGGWTESILYNFKGVGGASDGSLPFGPVTLDGAGNLYGTTQSGGLGNDCSLNLGGCGTVFKLSPGSGGGWVENVLYNFQGPGFNDGDGPGGGLIFDAAGNLYGTTVYGGGTACSGYGCGTVFELSPAGSGGWNETKLHVFGNHDAQNPYSLVFNASGSLYGVAALGGAFGLGAAFEVTPTSGGGWTESVLHSFGNGSDGWDPVPTPLLLDSAGNLYGATSFGGTHTSGACAWGPGCGTVFQLTP